MLWHIELKFCIWLCFTVLQIKFECRQFLWELCPFWNLEYWKYTVFRSFLLHPLRYWAESLHSTLFFCTTDQVGVSSICVYFGVMPLFELIILLIHFSALFSYTLWHIELKFCTLLCFTVLQVNFKCRQWVSIFVGVMILLGLRILEKHSFLHFSPAFFDILSWNFSYNFV